MSHTWRTRMRILLAKILIKLGKLTHSDYTEEELNALLTDVFPQTFKIDVPRGEGTLTLLEGEIKMPFEADALEVQLLGALLIEYMGNPIYRAHLVILIEAEPGYDEQTKSVLAADLRVKDIYFINDEYALLKDTQSLLDNLVPRPVRSLVSDTMKSALGMLTAGGSDTAMNYLRLYLSGSKQRILDYHRPQVEAKLMELAEDGDLTYALDDDDWQEYLFRRYGKTVVVENGCLRFKF